MRFQDAFLIDFGVIRASSWSQKGVKNKAKIHQKNDDFLDAFFWSQKGKTGLGRSPGRSKKVQGQGRGDTPATMPLSSIQHAGEVFEVQIDGKSIYKDDFTGQILDPALVRAARQKVLDFFEVKEVWTKRPIDEVRRKTGNPPITVRWVDVNKGHDLNPNIRSRLLHFRSGRLARKRSSLLRRASNH